MHRSIRRRWRLLFLPALLCGACRSPRPDPEAEQAIARAVGFDGAVTFRAELPLDEAPAGEHLTLEDAVRRAAAADPRLQAALARVRIAMADADQARLLANPVLGFVVRWGVGAPQFNISLAEELIDALRRPRRSSAADNRMRQAAADAVTSALDVVAEVQEQYAEGQAFGELLPVLEGRLALMDKLLDVARARLAANEGTRSDVTTLETQRVEVEVERADVRIEEKRARLRLARLVGEPSGAAAWQLDAWRPPPQTAVAEAGWIDAAIRNRPEVQAVGWQLAALGDEEALARLARWEGIGAGVEAEQDDGWSAGPAVSVPLPIFDDGSARRARVTAEQAEARHVLALARRTIVEEVRTALQALAGREANLRRVRQELIPLQQRRRQEAEDAYRAGQTDVTALFLAEQDLRAAQARAVDFERETTIARIRLERAVGGAGVANSMGDSNQ